MKSCEYEISFELILYRPSVAMSLKTWSSIKTYTNIVVDDYGVRMKYDNSA